MTILHFSDSRGSTSGTFTQGSHSLGSTSKPLLVLIHGVGVNSAYFDNEAHSVPRDFNEAGYDVLNLARVGYQGNPIQTSKTPLFDAVPVYADFINQVYRENHGGQGGVVLIGHSLGAATSLFIAASKENKFPLIGVSALGIVPSREAPSFIIEAINASPDADRLEMGEVDDEYFKTFLGAPDFFDVSNFNKLSSIYEGSPKNELVEWTNPSTYDQFVNEVAPAVRVPLQFLAAEIELQWSGIEQGGAIFENAKNWFTNVARLDADILPGGAHNYEFSVNSRRLYNRRLNFIESLQ